MNQIVNEIHSRVRNPKEYRKVLVNEINEIFSIDLVEMQEFENVNNGYRYILTVIDLYSRYAWAIPMINKTALETVKALQTIINESSKPPKKLWCDNGKEFKNKQVDILLKKYNIEIYSTYGNAKAATIERFNRSLKELMFKMFSLNSNRIWYDKLNELLNIYNNRTHKGIENKTPYNVYHNDINIKSNYTDDKQKTTTKFKINDRIRISYQKGVFDKGYLPNWSWEIYKIKQILDTKPTTFIIEDENGITIKGSFYSEQIKKTSQKDGVYLIQEIIKTKMLKGVKMGLVHWIGYDKPNQFTWEPYSELKDLKDIDNI